MDAVELLAEARRAQAAITEHKREIRRHRRALQRAFEALTTLQTECRRRGLTFNITPPIGEEREIFHGRSDDDPTADPAAQPRHLR